MVVMIIRRDCDRYRIMVNVSRGMSIGIIGGGFGEYDWDVFGVLRV